MLQSSPSGLNSVSQVVQWLLKAKQVYRSERFTFSINGIKNMYLNRDYRGYENQSDDKTETIDSNIFSGICGSIESGRKVSGSYSNVQKSTERSEIRLIMKTTHFWLAKDGHTFKTRTHSEWFSRPHEQQGWRKRARNRLLLMSVMNCFWPLRQSSLPGVKNSVISPVVMLCTFVSSLSTLCL